LIPLHINLTWNNIGVKKQIRGEKMQFLGVLKHGRKTAAKTKKWGGFFVEFCRSFKNTASALWCTLLLTEGARSLGLVLV